MGKRRHFDRAYKLSAVRFLATSDESASPAGGLPL